MLHSWTRRGPERNHASKGTLQVQTTTSRFLHDPLQTFTHLPVAQAPEICRRIRLGVRGESLPEQTIPPAQDVRRLREVMAALTRSALLDIASERVDVFAIGRLLGCRFHPHLDPV